MTQTPRYFERDSDDGRGPNNIVVPICQDTTPQSDGKDRPPPYSGTDQLPAETVIDELVQNVNELRAVSTRFGLKLPRLLFGISHIRKKLIRKIAELELSCLGGSDSFTCIKKDYIDKKKQQEGQFPLLYWLLDADMDTLESSYSVLLSLAPTSGSTACRMDVELAAEHIKLSYYVGGKYDKIVVLKHSIKAHARAHSHPSTLFGKPVQDHSDANNLNATPSVGPGINAMVEYMFPGQNTRWRSAMTDCLIPNTQDEETVLVKFAQACRCDDDSVKYPVNESQNERCRELVKLSPDHARDFLTGLIGKKGGPLCHQPYTSSYGMD